MLQKIEMEVNNGRTMQLAQHKYDEEITLTTFDTKSGLVDYEETITPGDMVLLINYYWSQKRQGLEVF